MIKSIITILILISINCLQGPEYLKDIEVGQKHDYNFEHDIDTDKSPQDLMIIVSRMLELKLSPDNWLLPEIVYLIKQGDCVEFVGLWMYLNQDNHDTYMVILENSKGSHAVGNINDSYYDIQCENVHTKDELYIYGEIKYIISYPEYIWMTYYWGKNVGKYY
jgi:hypothetical protein